MLVKNVIPISHILWLLLVLCFFHDAHTQTYTVNIQKLSVEDGLSNRFVSAIHRDSRGFIWLGTDYGLNRYDGYSFKHYTTANSNLESNIIRDLYEDDKQRLWIRHGAGLRQNYNMAILDLQTDSIQTFQQTFKENAPFSSNDIGGLRSGAGKILWIITKKNDIYRYREKRFKWILNNKKNFNGDFINADDSFYWFREKASPYKEKILKITLQGALANEFSLPDSTRVRVKGFDKDRSLWLLEHRKKKLFKIDNNNELQSFSLESLVLPEAIYGTTRYTKDFLNPFNGLIWWYHKEEREEQQPYLLVFDPRSGLVIDLQPELEPFFTYKSPAVRTIYFADEDHSWVATEDGVFIITLKKNKFGTLLTEKSETSSIRGLVKDRQGMLYVNTLNGRVQISPESGKAIKVKDKIWWGAGRDREGNLWFGRVGERIEKYNPVTQQSRYYDPAVPDPRSGDRLPYSFLQDKTGRMWIGFDTGLYFLEPGAALHQRFTRYNTFERYKNSSVYHLQEDKEGIWIASSTGLYLLEPGKGITRRYAADEKAPRYIPYDHLLHCYRDKAGIFWLATQGGGLICLNPEDGNYRQFTTIEGLSSNIIYAVYEDGYGKLWLPSNYGLMQFDKVTHEVNTYLKSEGIAHDEFNRFSHYRGDDGRLYFGGLAGVTIVDPENFTENTPAPAPLRLTGCQILNGKTGELTDKTTAVRASEAVHLSPSDKSLILDFALLNYENSRKNSYLYKIEGLDKDWTTIENNNTLRINNLPYGNYTVHIKGQDIKGAESANELVISVVVNKPFYLKTGFILGAVFVLGFLIYGIFQWRLQSLKYAKRRLEQTVRQRTQEISQQRDKIEQQAEKLKELDGLKSRFFANISHELRTPLTLILGPLNSLIGTLKSGKSTDSKENVKPLMVMQRNGKKLLQLIEEILDLSKFDARKLELQESPVTFYTFVKRLFVTFESHAVSLNISYRLYYGPDKKMQLLLDKNKAEKIITNFLSNAFKYSPDGTSIRVSVSEEDTFIRVAVQDNGPGIHPEDLPYVFDRFYQSKQANVPVQGGTGIGLALCKELATLMGGGVHVESRLGEGSTFSCTWPKKEGPTGLPQKEEPVITIEPETLYTEIVTETSAMDEPGGDLKEKHTVLVVEDHEDMRDFIVEILHPYYKIQTAGDGEKAISLLEKEPLPDVILSDVMMPRMDGFTLLKNVKSHPVWHHIPVVMLTARAAQEDRLQALGTGVDDYLTKPFDAPELLVRIRNLLNNYRERKQWQQQEHKETGLTIDFQEKPESWDTEWLEKARDIVKREIVNHKYKVSDLAAEMLISESQLLVKMKQITGLTPNEFIREIKLQKARVLLENNAKSTIAEVAYTVGFNTPGYFSTVYEKRFGKRPAAYLADY